MRLIALVTFVLALTACQSCKNTPTPAPPLPLQEAGVAGDASLDSPVVLVEAGVPEASAPMQDAAPSDPCFASVVGPAHAFCGVASPFFASVFPSMPQVKGKLNTFQPSSTASNRLIVRHSNGSTAKMKIVVVLTNKGFASGSFILFKKGVAGPTMDLPVGEELAAERWTASKADPAVPVPAGKSVRFDVSIEVGLHQKYATMGLYEYTFGQPHTVTVCLLGEREDWSACQAL